MEDAKIRNVMMFRIVFWNHDELYDEYECGYSAQDAVDRIRKEYPDSIIQEVAKIVKGWK